MNLKIPKGVRKVLFVLIWIFIIGLINLNARPDITGPSTMNLCDQGTFTITVTNDSPTQFVCKIVVTNTMPNNGFFYVPGTTIITLHDGSEYYDDPQESGLDLIWDINAIIGSNYQLPPGESITIKFDMGTKCDAVSGTDLVSVAYEDCANPGTPLSDTDSMSIEIRPGAVKISKTPSVVSASVGDNVTWTITVENTGLGTIKNVVVNDLLGSGLTYVSSNPPGNNAGQTTTWDSSNIPSLALIGPGEKVTIDITATVSACENLDNKTDARWGCDDGSICYDTAVNGGTATASVQLVSKNPNLDFNPPNVSFDYCSGSTNVSFPITNNGDGPAHNIKICVDLGGFSVSNLSPGASYSGGCFTIPDLGAGETYNLSFDLSYSNWCSPFSPRTLVWQPEYQDDCGNIFYPPVKISSLSGPASTPYLSVNKTGPSQVQIGSQVSYHIVVDYSGPTSCGSGTTGIVTVTDHVPDGFTVIDPGGGIWTPGGGGTGGTIVWTFDPSVNPHFETDITLQVPLIGQCEVYCYTTFINTVEANVIDCCGCELTGSDFITTAIECEELVDSEKTASPSTVDKCGEVTYTNTYNFTNNSALDGVDLSQLNFEEHAENNQQYVQGSLSVIFDGLDITSCVGVTDNTPGGSLFLDFSGCTGYGSVKNKNLTIVYKLRITDQSQPSPPCDQPYSFYSWSTLDLGITGGNCLPDGRIHETTEVAVEPPSMRISISGIPAIGEKCGTYSVDLIINRLSSVAVPYDVIVRLDIQNYSLISVDGYEGVLPVSGPSDQGTYIEWDYGDNFSSGNQGVIHLKLQKKCTGGANLTATVHYDDNCNNDNTPNFLCSATDTSSPSVLTSGDLIITKTPEIYYASTNSVQWTIYVINKGSGTAYNVWVDDVLGSGLTYSSSSVNPSTGVTTNPNQDHNGNPINGVS